MKLKVYTLIAALSFTTTFASANMPVQVGDLVYEARNANSLQIIVGISTDESTYTLSDGNIYFFDQFTPVVSTLNGMKKGDALLLTDQGLKLVYAITFTQNGKVLTNTDGWIHKDWLKKTVSQFKNIQFNSSVVLNGDLTTIYTVKAISEGGSVLLSDGTWYNSANLTPTGIPNR